MAKEGIDLMLVVIGDDSTPLPEIHRTMMALVREATGKEPVLVVDEEHLVQALNDAGLAGLGITSPIEDALRGMFFSSEGFIRTKTKPPGRRDTRFQPRVSKATARQYQRKPKIRARTSLKK